MIEARRRAAIVALAALDCAGESATFTVKSVTPEAALTAAKAALDKCRAEGFQVTVAVVDRSGVTVALVRDRYASPGSVEISQRKAQTAINFKMDTAALDRELQPGRPDGRASHAAGRWRRSQAARSSKRAAGLRGRDRRVGRAWGYQRRAWRARGPEGDRRRPRALMDRREFLHLLAIAGASGLPISSRSALAADGDSFYDIPRTGNVSLLHLTDTHAQLLPIHFREPNVNLGVASAANLPPHLVGDKFLAYYGMHPGSREAHAFTYPDFEKLAATYGRIGGYAHIATLVKRLKASRPGALLLDGGDCWQGSGTSLWTRGQDMIDAQKLLGVDIMTGHWEFTYGEARVKEVVEGDFKGKVEFLAQNVVTADFGDPVFKPYTMREINGVRVGIVGQAFPYTPIANPRYFVADWTFGIKEAELQKQVVEVRAKGAKAVVLLSHNGMDVDLKLASRVTGIDVILGGHTHDGIPAPVPVKNPGGTTLVTNAGSNGKFLAVLDMEVREGKRVRGIRYRLLPVFANLLPAGSRDGRT